MTCMTRHGIKLTLSKGDKAIAAHIIVEAATDQASFSWDNVSYSKSFDGTGLHGLTVPLKDPKDGTRERVYVFVPAKPRIDITNKKSREAGRDVHTFSFSCTSSFMQPGRTTVSIRSKMSFAIRAKS